MRTVFSRNERGERRHSPSRYKLLLTAHIIVSVGWLGVASAKLVVGLAAATSRIPAVAGSLYVAMDAMDVAFPPLAIGTLVTGVLLSLGTRWGLLDYSWVATKLALTVTVPVTAVQLGDRLQQSVAGPSGSAVDVGTILSIPPGAMTLLLGLIAVHVLMLGAATVLSVYKPWGTTWLGRRKTVDRNTRTATESRSSGRPRRLPPLAATVPASRQKTIP
jgi:hypothetical protein